MEKQWKTKHLLGINLSGKNLDDFGVRKVSFMDPWWSMDGMSWLRQALEALEMLSKAGFARVVVCRS